MNIHQDLLLASTFKDDVPKEEKNRRLQELQNLLKTQAEEKNRKRLGKVEEVLVEGWSPKGKELSGRTRDNKLVVFDGDESLIGEFVDIEITETSPFFLKGKVLERVESILARKG